MLFYMATHNSDPTPADGEGSLLITNARILTMQCEPATTPTGLGVIPCADVGIHRGVITSIRAHRTNDFADSSATPSARADRVIDAAGGVLLPGFVDCHTHLCWAGSRIDEWERTLEGAAYLDILAGGGGIMSTVRAVRAASPRELEELTLARLHDTLSQGTTTIEIKSGYGLDTENELKMLRAIVAAAARWPGTVVPTALLGHAIPPANESGGDSPAEFVHRTINETLPAVHAEFPGVCIDAYCEQGAWSVKDCVRLFERAIELGHPVRVHADQFNSLGMVQQAVRLGAISVDHLEAATDDDWSALAGSCTAAVILPCCGLHVDGRYARPPFFPRNIPTPPTQTTPDCRHITLLCIATNSNPGSAPCRSMPMALALAVRNCGVRIPDALLAGTAHPAKLLGFADRGTIRVGARADLLLLHGTDEREIVYRFGDAACIRTVIVGGRIGLQP